MLTTLSQLKEAALQIKKDLLTLCAEKSIHIGGDLSVADVMTALWQYQMRYDPQNPEEEGRDRFILSKGHAAAVTSLNQAAIGCFRKEDFFEEDDSFKVHDERMDIFKTIKIEK